MKFVKRILNSFVKAEKRPVDEFPSNILLEPTNACNLRCRMCPAYGEGVQRKRDIGFISKEVWTKAIDEIGAWPSCVNLDLHGAGEPLLHPDFFDIVSYAKDRNNITLGFLCNATLLDKNKAHAVVANGVDWICFSVDGSDKEVFEYYRKGALLDVVEENINYLLSLRINDTPRVSLNMVGHREADAEKFIGKWAGHVEGITISIKRSVVSYKSMKLELIKPCPLLYRQLVVGWSGRAGLCCEDFWIDYVTGEYPSAKLYDIWHGGPLNRARELHEAGRYKKLDLCRTCDSIIFHQYGEKVIEINGRKTFVRRELEDINPEFVRS